MTSDKNSGSQGAGRPPPSTNKRARSRADQGDLWSDEPARPPETSSSPPGTSPTPPVAPSRATPRPAQATSASRPPEPDPEDLNEQGDDVGDEQTASLLQAPLGSAAATGATRRTTGARTAPPPPAPVYDEPEYYYEDEDEEYYEASGSVMLNPFVLAAGAVIAAILLAIFVVFFFGQGDDSQTVVVNGNVTVTPSASNNGPAFVGLQARSLATATVREGPGPAFLELGLLRARQDVDITGRNEDATWFQIVFPANSNLRGWVPATALQLPDNVLDVVALADVTPVPRPEVEEPTPVPFPTDEPIPEATATPEPGQFADIAVFITSDCSRGSDIVIQLTNVGTIPLQAEPIQIIVANDGTIVYNQAFEADMEPGASVPLNTGVPAEPSTMMVTVLLQAQEDINAGNNASSCTVQGGGGNVPPPIGGDDDDDDD